MSNWLLPKEPSMAVIKRRQRHYARYKNGVMSVYARDVKFLLFALAKLIKTLGDAEAKRILENK